MAQILLGCLIFEALAAAHTVYLPLYGKFPKPPHTSYLVRKHRSQPCSLNTMPLCLPNTVRFELTTHLRINILTSHIAISVCDQQGLLTPELPGLLVGMSQWLEIMGWCFSREGRENRWQWVGKQGPIPGQQFSDEHTPPSQSKTFHCILLGPKESSKTFSMPQFRGETKVIPTGTEAKRASETTHIGVDLRCGNIVFQIRNTIQPSKEGKLKLLVILWCVTTCSHYCSP